MPVNSLLFSGADRRDIVFHSIEQAKSFPVNYSIRKMLNTNFKHNQDTYRSRRTLHIMPNRGQKNMVRRTPVGARGRRSARLESAAERTLPEVLPSNEQDDSSDTSQSSSEASARVSVAATSLQKVLSKKRAKRTPFCLEFEEEQLMCEFLRENTILWDIKKTDYRRVDKKKKLWEDQANVLGKSVAHLQCWFKSLRDTNTRLHKKRSWDPPNELTERELWVKTSFEFLKSVVRHRAGPIKSIKQTIAEHGGDLEAVEEVCATIAEDQQRSSSPVQNPDTATKVKTKRGHEDEEVLLTLRKRVDESGELLKGIGQRHVVAGNVAYANYLHEIVVCMSRTKFRKARSSFNQILNVLLDEDSDPDDAPTAYAFPARASIPSSVASENIQFVQPSDQPNSDQCRDVMLPPSKHVYRQVASMPVELPGSASSPASMGSPGPQTSSNRSFSGKNKQNETNISGFSTLLNLSSGPIASSTPCTQTTGQDSQLN